MTDLVIVKNVTNETVIVKNELLMDPAGYIITAFVLFLIGFCGFFLNLFVILLMWKDKQLWTPLNIILFNLVCSDFSVSIFGNPWTFISAMSYGWIWGSTMCVMYGFFMSLLGITSITTLTVLAFERFMIVSKPFQRKCINRTNAFYMVIGIWTYSLILTTPPLMGWGKYGNEAANISCSVNWEDRGTNAKSYIMYLFFFGLVVPIIVIGYSYTFILITMRANKMNMGQICRVESRVAYTVFMMILAFLLAWTPYSIFALLAQFGDPTLVTPSSGVVPALIAKSSICYNPIIYVGLNRQFQQSLKELFQKESTRTINHSCETYALAVSKYISENNKKMNSTDKKKEARTMTKLEEVSHETEDLL
ncbi:unnamed protein product [Ceutorhynchus assimilis]|uniref:G-protein coupled receptors family 1 profile domain-containing protein n=1 Tax=Ceutorhynchus assimilis TaxID=467358 RepID=A0A9N9MD07_9CUCU|nr:unnamed protein product [Ceutorhynchus assimilis]